MILPLTWISSCNSGLVSKMVSVLPSRMTAAILLRLPRKSHKTEAAVLAVIGTLPESAEEDVMEVVDNDVRSKEADW